MDQKWKSLPNPGTHITASDLAGVWLRDAGQCYLCETEVTLMQASFDHVIPWADGGPHSVANLRTCCIACQRSKYTKSPKEYANYQKLERRCLEPSCNVLFKPRWADYLRGYGYYHSRSCSAKAAKR